MPQILSWIRIVVHSISWLGARYGCIASVRHPEGTIQCSTMIFLDTFPLLLLQ